MGTRLGQNFLTNPAVIDFIAEDIKKNADLSLDTIEIGPGKCALTQELVKLKPDLKVFEKDESLKKYLLNCVKEENIILGDFLEADLSKYINGNKFNAIGNLPYYITSPIFRKLMVGGQKRKSSIKWQVESDKGQVESDKGQVESNKWKVGSEKRLRKISLEDLQKKRKLKDLTDNYHIIKNQVGGNIQMKAEEMNKYNNLSNNPEILSKSPANPALNPLILSYGIFMIQKEVGEKIKTDAKNKSMLRYLLNLNHKITYLKTVPAEDFSPPPKVESCLVRFEYTGANPDIDPNRLFDLLSLITPIKKKTLGKIEKILQKQGKQIIVPEDIKQKRIHELDYSDLKRIKVEK